MKLRTIDQISKNHLSSKISESQIYPLEFNKHTFESSIRNS